MPEHTIITCSGGLARLTLQVHYASSDSRLGGRVQAHQALVYFLTLPFPPAESHPAAHDATPNSCTIGFLAFGSHHQISPYSKMQDHQACNKSTAI